MTTATNDKKWYVVRAVSGQEAKIKEYIKSEISRVGYDHLVEDLLVPTEKVIQIRNGKKISKERTYFPGYIMIKANLSGELPHIIKSVQGVKKMQTSTNHRKRRTEPKKHDATTSKSKQIKGSQD